MNELPTLGIDFAVRVESIPLELPNGKSKTIEAKIQIWDVSGRSDFRSMHQVFLRSAHCLILVYDITNLQSFESVKMELETNFPTRESKFTLFVVGNKLDLVFDHQ